MAAVSPTASAMGGVPASKRVGRRRPGRKRVELHVEDHAAAAEERAHRLEQLAACPRARRCRSGPSSCGPRRPGSRRRASATETGACGTSWAPSATTTAPAACAASAITRTGLMVPSTFDMHDTPTSFTPSTKRLEVVEDQPAVAVDRDVAQVEAAQLLGQHHPRHDVGVVLHLRQQHGVARPQVGPAPRVGHQVERLGGVLGEDDLVGRIGSADEAPGHHAGPLVERRRLLGRGVDAAVHVGVGRLVVARSWR